MPERPYHPNQMTGARGAATALSRLFAVGILACSPAMPSLAQNLTILCNFAGTEAVLPTGLVQAPDGSFYGASHQGGTLGYGDILHIASDGTVTTLYSFTGFDASGPNGVIFGPDHDLYGTVYGSGEYQAGYVFKLSLTGTLTVLASFNGQNGRYPAANLLLANDGNFYGTTLEGGRTNNGTVFRMTSDGQLTVLHSFDRCRREVPDGFFDSRPRWNPLWRGGARRSEWRRHALQNHRGWVVYAAPHI